MKSVRSILLVSLAVLTCPLTTGAQAGKPRAQAALLVTSFTNNRPIVTFQGGSRPARPDFKGAVVRNWRTNYALFSKALVEAAQQQHLDSVSLAAILQRLPSAPENERIALLPVAAQSAEFHGEWAWTITLQWEGADYAVETGRMVHHRYFIFSQETLKQLDFQTCM